MVLRIHVGTSVQQKPRCVGVARTCSKVQGRKPISARPAGVCSGLNQKPEHFHRGLSLVAAFFLWQPVLVQRGKQRASAATRKAHGTFQDARDGLHIRALCGLKKSVAQVAAIGERRECETPRLQKRGQLELVVQACAVPLPEMQHIALGLDQALQIENGVWRLVQRHHTLARWAQHTPCRRHGCRQIHWAALTEFEPNAVISLSNADMSEEAGQRLTMQRHSPPNNTT